MNEIIPSFTETFFDSSKDMLVDITELGIDSIIKVGEKFPLASTLIGIKNVTQNLYERNLLIQSLEFINEFKSGNISSIKFQNYRNEINCNPKKAEKEFGRIIIILNKTIEVEKSKILANLFRNYINEFINWAEFCEFAEIVDRMFISDLEYLKSIAEFKTKNTEYISLYRIERLSSLGLIYTSSKEQYLIDTHGKYNREEKFITISEIGEKFYKSIT